MSQQQAFSGTSLPGTANVEFLKGNDGVMVPPNPATHVLNVVGNTTQGVSVSGNAGTYTETITVADATTTQKGVVKLPTQVIALNYTPVTSDGTLPFYIYTATTTDYFISCDSTLGPIKIELPDTTTNYREFVVKDRTGQSSTNNITITTVTGTDLIDGATSYIIQDNYESTDILWNGTSYETF